MVVSTQMVGRASAVLVAFPLYLLLQSCGNGSHSALTGPGDAGELSEVDLDRDDAGDPGDRVTIRYISNVEQLERGSTEYRWSSTTSDDLGIEDWLYYWYAYSSRNRAPTWPPQFANETGDWTLTPESEGWIPTFARDPATTIEAMRLATEAVDDVTARGSSSLTVTRPGSDDGERDEASTAVELEFRVVAIGCSLYDDNPDPNADVIEGVRWQDTTWSTPFCQRFVAERDRIVAAIEARDAAEAAR